MYEQLRDHIVSGDVAPGASLPSERVLSERLGVNRAAIREGLKRLEQAGLVAIQQGVLPVYWISDGRADWAFSRRCW